MSEQHCPVCMDEGWVCINHNYTKWGYGEECCRDVGVPCSCNLIDYPTHIQKSDE